MRKLLDRIAVLVGSSVVALSLGYGYLQNRPVRTTLGHLREHAGDHEGYRVVVSNCVGSRRVGRYVVFDSPDRASPTVVVSPREGDRGGTVYAGYCLGLVEDPLVSGIDPPFVFVIDARSPD